MTTRARINALLDGTGTLTIGERTQSVEAESLSAGLAELLALTVAESSRLGHPVDVIAHLENSPTTGLHVQPDGQIIEDPAILNSSLFTAAPPALRTVAPARRRRRGPVLVAGFVLVLLSAAGAWATLGGGETPAAPTAGASSSPDPAPTSAVTQRVAPTPSATRSTEQRIRVRVRTRGGREELRFTLVANQRAAVRLKTWRRGDLAAARTRSVRLSAESPAVVRLPDLSAGQWLWRVRGDETIPTSGRVRVKAAPVPRTPVPPSSRPTPTAPTTTATPQPLSPQPTRSPVSKPTKKPTKKPIRPNDDGPIKPTDDGPIKP